MAYFVGQLGNTLPLPGGVGGVEGALFGVLVAFGEPAGPALAGVLAYRARVLAADRARGGRLPPDASGCA
jgi:uncharacterized membrane protein YbhN (UPF0104 family)